MKKKLYIILLLFLVNIGIVNAKEEYSKDTRMVINNDNSIRLIVDYSANYELLDKYGLEKNDLFDADTFTINLKEKGYEISESFILDGVALEISKTFGDLSSLSQLEKTEINLTDISKETYNDSVFFQKKVGLFYTTYKAKFIFDYTDVKNEEVDIDKIASINFVLHSAKKLSSHNASEIIEEENITKWNLKVGQKNEVNFEIKEFNVVVGIVLAIISIALLVMLVVLFVRKLSHKKIEYEETKGRKTKKEKKKKEKKVKQKNIHNNGMTFDDQVSENVGNPDMNEIKPEPQTNQNQPNMMNVNPNNQMENQNMMNQAMVNPNNQMENQNMMNQTMVNPYNQMGNSNMMNNQVPNPNGMNGQMGNPNMTNYPNNQMQRPDLMAPQQPMNNPNLFNQQPVNAPGNNNGLYNAEPNDYTSVFNQSFDFDDKNNNGM